MNKLKIGFVLDDTLDTPDGVQQYILTLGRWLSTQGHEVHYLVGQTSRTDIPFVHSLGRNVHVKFNGNRMSTPLPASRQAIKALLERERFDVLHVQIPYSPFLAQRIILAATKETVVVGTFHIAPHTGLVRIANKLLGLLVRRSLQRFDAIYSVSSAAADFARATYGIETAILPNVVNAGYFQQAQSMQRPDNRPVVVFLGRLVPRKGCGILLEALRMLQKQDPDSLPHTIICGKGPLKDTLEAYARTSGLQESVQFVGFVDDNEKARYLKTADIAVFPSTGGESFGIVLIEAMAARHPVVLGAANPGYQSVLSPSPQSLFAVNDPKALADSLRQFLQDAELRARVVTWQDRYIMQFDVAVVGRRLVSRYLELLRAKRSMR